MNQTTRTGFGVLAVALTLGLLGDVLLRPLPWGVGYGLWWACFIAVIPLVARWAGSPLRRGD